MEAGIRLRVHGLDTGRVVDVRHSGDLGAGDVELVNSEQPLLLSVVRAPASRTSATSSM